MRTLLGECANTNIMQRYTAELHDRFPWTYHSREHAASAGIAIIEESRERAAPMTSWLRTSSPMTPQTQDVDVGPAAAC
jgi:hypothetical protein